MIIQSTEWKAQMMELGSGPFSTWRKCWLLDWFACWPDKNFLNCTFMFCCSVTRVSMSWNPWRWMRSTSPIWWRESWIMLCRSSSESWFWYRVKNGYECPQGDNGFSPSNAWRKNSNPASTFSRSVSTIRTGLIIPCLLQGKDPG